LSVSACSGNPKPPCLQAKSSWLCTYGGLMASTVAPASVKLGRSSL
jgi:hypothetical protein